jgi:hypothetical protein
MFNRINNLFSGIKNARKHAKLMRDLMLDTYLQNHLVGNPKYADTSRYLNSFEFSVFSQNGEDGILEEIFNRIGVTNKYFVEIGVQEGSECNSSFLFLKGWEGLWIEADPKMLPNIEKYFSTMLNQGRLSVVNEFASPDNIERLLSQSSAPNEPDLLSIDIDGNDYWVWQSIDKSKPRVLVIEYNSSIPPTHPWIMEFNPSHRFDLTTHFGASLKSLQQLGDRKGYSLVGCDFTGTNAFFVRSDLIGDCFVGPFTSENYYEPSRYFLASRHFGHKPKFGPYVTE